MGNARGLPNNVKKLNEQTLQRTFVRFFGLHIMHGKKLAAVIFLLGLCPFLRAQTASETTSVGPDCLAREYFSQTMAIASNEMLSAGKDRR